MKSDDSLFQAMVNGVVVCLKGIPEHRSGQNIQYEIADAGLGAFGTFFTQCPSFLAYQRQMEKSQGRNNARSLFGVEKIPSDPQIRNLLDPVAPHHLQAAFWDIYEKLHIEGTLDSYRQVGGTLLCSLDGTQYFSSQKVHCPHCTVRVVEEEAHYSHTVLAVVLVKPNNPHVIALAPEFIRRQDGHNKQDCEQAAIKRWVKQHQERFAPWSITILADDLHSHQPLCDLLHQHEMHFIMTCKTDSHTTLYEEVDLLSQLRGGVQTLTTRRWNGRYGERNTYRWAERVPLRRGKDVRYVNWCEVTVVQEDTGKTRYHNAWVTSHELSKETVIEVAAAGRAHWKVENENFNVLKNHGYRLEHNYGHGKQHLSTVLLSLLLLAFLFHTALHLHSQRYQAIREALGPRQTFFNDLRALTRYLHFESWNHLLDFMCDQLELSPG